MKVLIIDGNSAYAEMFIKRGWEITYRFFEADLIQFTGGADVTPEIYGEKNTHSHNDFNRDLKEAGYFALAQRMGKPMAGICRGGQFLNVMCGGSMIQHVEGHATGKTHVLFDMPTRLTHKVTSTHHQAMVPYIEDDYYARQFMGGDVLARANDDVVEVIHYEMDRVLCFQPHPEFGKGECQDYYFELLDRCLGLKV